MVWTKKQIKQHKEAAALLEEIKNEAFEYIKTHERCTEREVQNLIAEAYKEHNLKSALNKPIVAFGEGGAFPHYDASEQKKERHIKRGDVVEIDVWARLNEPRAPFADITWVGYRGTKIPKKVTRVFLNVVTARDASVSCLKEKLKNKAMPTGYEVDQAAMQVLIDAGFRYRKEILHTTGHSIGTTSPHGRFGGVSSKNKQPLKRNVGYTIEPGIYIKNAFGIRSEIDFYITRDYTLDITTPVQKELLLL